MFVYDISPSIISLFSLTLCELLSYFITKGGAYKKNLQFELQIGFCCCCFGRYTSIRNSYIVCEVFIEVQIGGEKASLVTHIVRIISNVTWLGYFIGIFCLLMFVSHLFSYNIYVGSCKYLLQICEHNYFFCFKFN